MAQPAVIPHDVDNGPQPAPVTDDTKTADGGSPLQGNPPPQDTKTQRQPDGTEVQKEITK